MSVKFETNHSDLLDAQQTLEKIGETGIILYRVNRARKEQNKRFEDDEDCIPREKPKIRDLIEKNSVTK